MARAVDLPMPPRPRSADDLVATGEDGPGPHADESTQAACLSRFRRLRRRRGREFTIDWREPPRRIMLEVRPSLDWRARGACRPRPSERSGRTRRCTSRARRRSRSRTRARTCRARAAAGRTRATARGRRCRRCGDRRSRSSTSRITQPLPPPSDIAVARNSSSQRAAEPNCAASALVDRAARSCRRRRGSRSSARAGYSEFVYVSSRSRSPNTSKPGVSFVILSSSSSTLFRFFTAPA